MNELSLDRFRTLADAYGGVVSRWPERERDAARRIATRPEAAAILRQALALDTELDTWRVAAPSLAFRDRVVAQAPLPAASIGTRARLWWSGIGIATALAGAAAGFAAAAVTAPIDATADAATSFGDVAGQES